MPRTGAINTTLRSWWSRSYWFPAGQDSNLKTASHPHPPAPWVVCVRCAVCKPFQELEALLGSDGEGQFNTFLGISDQFLRASSMCEINISAATRSRLETFRSRWGTFYLSLSGCCAIGDKLAKQIKNLHDFGQLSVHWPCLDVFSIENQGLYITYICRCCFPTSFLSFPSFKSVSPYTVLSSCGTRVKTQRCLLPAR